MSMSESDILTIIASFSVLYIVMLVLYVFGYITMVLALTHSIKKRVVSGEDFSAGSVFGWIIGWMFAMVYTGGLATIIYFFAKRSEMQATKQKCSMVLANTRNANMQQFQQQQFQQQPYQQQNPYQQPPNPYQ